MALQVFQARPKIMAMPHWHAQVELNFVIHGHVAYRLGGRDVRLRAGDMCLFWGGQPHEMYDASTDAYYAGVHLPLFNFFTLRLPSPIYDGVIKGSILLTTSTGAADHENFSRWYRYIESGNPAKIQNAIDELLLRIERIGLEAYEVPDISSSPREQLVADSRKVSQMGNFVAANFLNEINSDEIARSAGLHPKYAMGLFKKSTGMTLSKYINLLRISRSQALLMREGRNVLQVAMDSGFGSVSAFNKSFRSLAGMSPSDFRRDFRTLVLRSTTI